MSSRRPSQTPPSEPVEAPAEQATPAEVPSNPFMVPASIKLPTSFDEARRLFITEQPIDSFPSKIISPYCFLVSNRFMASNQSPNEAHDEGTCVYTLVLCGVPVVTYTDSSWVFLNTEAAMIGTNLRDAMADIFTRCVGGRLSFGDWEIRLHAPDRTNPEARGTVTRAAGFQDFMAINPGTGVIKLRPFSNE